jgi:hypothetical protein
MQLEDQNAAAAANEDPQAGTGAPQADPPSGEGAEGRAAPQDEGGGDEGEPGAGERQEGGEPEGGQPQRAKMPAWMQHRIDEITRARREAERERDAAREELRRMRGEPDAEQEEQPAEGTGDRQRQPQRQQPGEPRTEDEVQRAAQALRQREKFDEGCNTTFEQGVKDFPDFQERMREFTHLGGLPNDFIEDVLEAGNAHKVLHHLGGDLDEASRIMRLPARARAVALTRLSDKLGAPKPPPALSKAPPPIDPVGGRGRVDSDPDKMSTDEWMRRRNAGEIK